MTRFVFLLIVIIISLTVNAQQLPSKVDVINVVKSVNNYWISQNQDPGNNQWARAAYFTGNVDFYKVYPKGTYLQYIDLWANNNTWALNGGTTTRNADNQIAGQVYIDLYNMDTMKQPSKINDITTCIDNMVNSTQADDWWWVDALYMAMPVFARLGVLYNDSAYFNKMYDLYYNTKVTRGLYNTTENLWYRDESFDPPYYTPNGEDSYWSRGNGWVFAAHVKVLQLLPVNNIRRSEYIETFQKMALALKNRQRTDGFWNVSLDDPNDFGGPETSGTSFFTYGMAWGINNDILDSATYYPVVAKAWNGLATIAVQSNGFLGYIQGVGSNPASSQPVTSASTADFGVGAFLLAGSEVVKLATGDMPVPSTFSLNSVKAVDANHVKLWFNKKTDSITTLNPSNYTIDNSVTVSAVTKGEADSICILVVNGLNFGPYHLQVNNVKSADSSQIETGENKTFVYTGIAEVTASGYEAGTSNTPDKTLDFDFLTRWSSLGSGEWILYDLGEIRQVTSVDIAFYNGNVRKAYFSIQLSANGTNFTEVFNGESSGTTLNLENFDFTDQNARYVKIIGYGNSQSLWNSITETRINWDVLTLVINSKMNSRHELVISPNPLQKSKISIELSQKINRMVNVSITDLRGRMVYAQSVFVEENTIVLDNIILSEGTYIITTSCELCKQSGLLKVNRR